MDINVQELKERLDKGEEFVLIDVRQPNGRSGQAKQFLMQNGFTNVRNLQGGMLAWVDAFGATK